MSLTLDDIKRVANLACIETSETEAAAALVHLSGIFSLIEQMQAVDTSTVKPMSHAQDVMQRLRDDMVTESDQRELFQSIAPKTESGLYLVPKVLE
ncbi:MAG: Asp-tRNA(Asn)/Glu-tRNA(Gln) amidotransferase subunit GatC [Nitrosomonadaceae bacterium]|jgi:aspartyl-tRNA(Asn)/glutamyl-tRNA(Gln) amidotransferase subunit C